MTANQDKMEVTCRSLLDRHGGQDPARLLHLSGVAMASVLRHDSGLASPLVGWQKPVQPGDQRWPPQVSGTVPKPCPL